MLDTWRHILNALYDVAIGNIGYRHSLSSFQKQHDACSFHILVVLSLVETSTAHFHVSKPNARVKNMGISWLVYFACMHISQIDNDIIRHVNQMGIFIFPNFYGLTLVRRALRLNNPRCLKGM